MKLEKPIILKVISFFATCLLWSGTPLSAESGTRSNIEPSSGPNAGPNAEKERLLASAPEGWRVILKNENEFLRLIEFVPPDSDESSWTERLKIESFKQQVSTDPLELIDSMAAGQEEACETFHDLNTFSGFENNYPTSVHLFNCDKKKQSQMQLVSLIKVIQGAEFVYVISREMRLGEQQSDIGEDRIKQTIARWSADMAAIKVCNAQEHAHPCPEPSPKPSRQIRLDP